MTHHHQHHAGPYEHWIESDRRERRVLLALLVIIGLSLYDLNSTMHSMLTTGMFEINPLARWIVASTGSVTALAWYKAVTVGVSLLILYRLRAVRATEWACWGLVIVLLVLAVQWTRYNATMASVDPELFAINAASHDDWVRVERPAPTRGRLATFVPTGTAASATALTRSCAAPRS